MNEFFVVIGKTAEAVGLNIWHVQLYSFSQNFTILRILKEPRFVLQVIPRPNSVVSVKQFLTVWVNGITAK